MRGDTRGSRQNGTAFRDGVGDAPLMSDYTGESKGPPSAQAMDAAEGAGLLSTEQYVVFIVDWALRAGGGAVVYELQPVFLPGSGIATASGASLVCYQNVVSLVGGAISEWGQEHMEDTMRNFCAEMEIPLNMPFDLCIAPMLGDKLEQRRWLQKYLPDLCPPFVAIRPQNPIFKREELEGIYNRPSAEWYVIKVPGLNKGRGNVFFKKPPTFEKFLDEIKSLIATTVINVPKCVGPLVLERQFVLQEHPGDLLLELCVNDSCELGRRLETRRLAMVFNTASPTPRMCPIWTKVHAGGSFDSHQPIVYTDCFTENTRYYVDRWKRLHPACKEQRYAREIPAVFKLLGKSLARHLFCDRKKFASVALKFGPRRKIDDSFGILVDVWEYELRCGQGGRALKEVSAEADKLSATPVENRQEARDLAIFKRVLIALVCAGPNTASELTTFKDRRFSELKAALLRFEHGELWKYYMSLPITPANCPKLHMNIYLSCAIMQIAKTKKAYTPEQSIVRRQASDKLSVENFKELTLREYEELFLGLTTLASQGGNSTPHVFSVTAVYRAASRHFADARSCLKAQGMQSQPANTSGSGCFSKVFCCPV